MLHTRIVVVAAMLVLGCCAIAEADVRVFVTSSADGYGLDLIGPDGDGTGTDPEHDDWPIDPFRPTYSTVDLEDSTAYGYDYTYAYYRVNQYPSIDAPSGTIDNPILIDAAAEDWGYMWFQFRQEYFAAYADYLHVVITEAGSTEPTTDVVPTYYLQNDWDWEGQKRWNGPASPETYPEWHSNPQSMVSVTVSGITNHADEPVNMFENQAVEDEGWTGVALLGALQGDPVDTVYELKIRNVTYGHPPYPEVGESCFFKFVPEPAAAWLLATIVLSTRRRS